MADEVERFRARFRGVERQQPTGSQGTADERLRVALDLHAFNLLLTIDKVRSLIGDVGEAVILEEVNRRRLASSPMPKALRTRALRRDAEARSN